MNTLKNIRNDAVLHNGRYLVPTMYGRTSGNTKWVHDLDGFRSAGGCAHYSEDQTEVTLSLPEGFKFSIRFNEKQGA